MKNVKISINRAITEEIYSGDTTINDILLEHGTVGDCCVVYIGADRIENKNMTLDEVSDADTIRITVVENKANAAGIEVHRLGNTLVFNLGYKLEEIDEVSKVNPNALRRIDEKGNTTFILSLPGKLKGSTGAYGMEIDGVPAPNGDAICTVDCYLESDDEVLDHYYNVINEVSIIASQISEALAAISVAKENARRCLKF